MPQRDGFVRQDRSLQVMMVKKQEMIEDCEHDGMTNEFPVDLVRESENW